MKTKSPETPHQRPMLAISACLLGQKVRYNGGHAQSDWVRDQLSAHVDFVPFCPEAPALGTPRDTISLRRIEGQLRLWTNKDQLDVTEKVDAESQSILHRLAHMPLDGILLKAKSPTCGLERIKVYKVDKTWLGADQGLTSGWLASGFVRQFPLLPKEDEGRLEDAWLRKNFVLSIFTLARWRQMMQKPSVTALQEFHRRHKFLLQYKNEQILRKLGPLVAQESKHNLEEVCQSYHQELQTLLQTPSSRGAMINVLEHWLGFFKNQLSAEEKLQFKNQLEDFRAGIIPLIALLMRFEHWVMVHEVGYLADQWLLNPYPKSLALRSSLEATRAEIRKK